ncbi:MAG: trypsin-like peptidase domain-containing protein [Okeania sp. SIO3I5]|uniref:trypsin-like peptidase domain-containing protein n=1 Tax=Okeania sp. SIO3I5 TaxID=2607805 RepID=UPI0013B79B3A|nr:effector-associated domain EAD1-containing protein [Okeania sp. SIO3I5]NEQ39162.1 trypsin-like peptidase domain-containing protein [Okeania sp. SIO3I5]
MNLILSRSERKKLSEALVDAFRRYNKLKIMVSYQLDENLDAIVEKGPLNEVAFNLVDWAGEQNKLEQLIIGARKENSGNYKLQEFYEIIFQRWFIVNPRMTPSEQKIFPDLKLAEIIEEVELQTFLQPEPKWLDVGFLQQALAQTASVCRVEIPSKGIKGTGVLITEQLVLTNYHVLEYQENDVLEANALDVTLRFGCFTGEDGKETEGKCFSLDRQKAIVCSSHWRELDYVLLQVDGSICGEKKLKPVNWETNSYLAPRMGLHLLQHPEGDSMKLSISHDGITGVYPQRGLVQYVNQSAVGSSGSPCFDENWKLVALHHATKSKYFGAIREGILWSSIYQEIRSFL